LKNKKHGGRGKKSVLKKEKGPKGLLSANDGGEGGVLLEKTNKKRERR